MKQTKLIILLHLGLILSITIPVYFIYTGIQNQQRKQRIFNEQYRSKQISATYDDFRDKVNRSRDRIKDPWEQHQEYKRLDAEHKLLMKDMKEKWFREDLLERLE